MEYAYHELVLEPLNERYELSDAGLTMESTRQGLAIRILARLVAGACFAMFPPFRSASVSSSAHTASAGDMGIPVTVVGALAACTGP